VEPASQHGHSRLDFIQALRGLAAFGVVMYHEKFLINGPDYSDAGDRLFGWGAAGVDLFFVISGFIMVHTTARSDGSLRYTLEFLCKRLARIWPVYVIWMLVYVAFVESVPRLGIALARAIVFYPQSASGPPFFGGAPNGVGWTLNYEVWFYVLFAASLLAGRWRWNALAALMIAFGIAIPLALTGGVNTSAYGFYALPSALLRLAANPLMWDFAAGVAIALVYRSRFQIRNARVLGLVLVLALTVEVWQLGSGYRQGYGFFAWGSPIAVSVLAIALWNKHRPIAVPRALVWLGDVSFSLYLLHRIPILLALRLPRELVGGFPHVIGTIALSLVLADLSARYLERGLAEWVRDRLLSRVRAAHPSR
jgi:exopolysaccharide production protein ExoZ